MCANFNPENVQALIGMSFITRSKSRYEIVAPSNFKKTVANDLYASRELVEDPETIYAVAGIKTGFFGMSEHELDQNIERLSIPGYYATDRAAYDMRMNESRDQIIEFLKENGREPREGDKLFLAIPRPFEHYNDVIVSSPDRFFPVLTPFIVTTPIDKIV
jgi:hypothetical protein